MEWSRAKSILILTFIVLNVLIGYQLWMNTQSAQQWISKSELRDETLDKLKNKGIELQAELPDHQPRLQEITVFFTSAENGTTTGLRPLTPPIAVEDISKPRTVKNITEQIPEFPMYAMDDVLTREEEFVYYQLHEKWPMFEINLQLRQSDNKWVSYTMRHATVEEYEEEDQQTVLSAYKAVSALADYVLGEGSVIVDVRLGYHGQVYDSSSQVLAPKWRIALDNGELYYVHAINGAVEKKE